MRAGKHYATFKVFTRSGYNANFTLGVMRPGQANQCQYAYGYPTSNEFYQHFSNSNKRESSLDFCNYNGSDGYCYSNTWGNNHYATQKTWEGMESMSPGEDTFGMLLDLGEGALSVFINGRKLGVMKSGLVGQYCWVVSLWKGTQVTIKRGPIPPS